MKKIILIAIGIFVVPALGAVIASSIGCSSERASDAQLDQYAQGLQLYGQDEVGKLAQNIKYFVDPRTNLCFAYFWGGNYMHGGPAFTCVPCDSIPRSLMSKVLPSSTHHWK